MNIRNHFPERLASINISSVRPELVFLVLAIAFGGLFVFMTPPVAVVDEENHFFRAYELSQGNLFTDRLNEGGAYGANIPENLAYYIYDNKGIALELNDKSLDHIAALGNERPDNRTLREVVYNASAAYSPAGYVPQTAGMVVARAINLSNEGYLYLGRIFNLLLFIGLTYFAMRLLPIGKYILLAVALLPMSLYQAASLSADATVMSGFFLLMAGIIKLIVERRLPGGKFLGLLLVAGIVVALTKYVYLVAITPLVVFWIVTLKKKYRLKGVVFVALVAVLSFAALIAWNAQLSPQVTAPAGVLESGEKIISVTKQLQFILGNPIAYLQSVINLIFFDSAGADVGVRGMFGRFGWRGADYFIPLLSMIVSIGAITSAVLVDKALRLKSRTFETSEKLNGWLSLTLISSFAFTIIAVITALYLAFTSVGSSEILGVQGRYFIPILPLLALGFVFMRPLFITGIKVDAAKVFVYGIVVFNLLYASAKIFEIYYI